MPGSLRPSLTMSEIHGPGHFFFPRAIDGHCDWLPNEPHQLDSFTGGQLVVAGDMSIVCSEGFVSPAARELLALAGLEIASERIVYRAGEELGALSRAAAANPGGSVVLSHAMPPELLQGTRCWVEPRLLSYLNNKGSLPALVRSEHTPPRHVFEREEYFSSGDQRLPAVIKAASDQTSGGGCAVMICRTEDDLKAAETLFRDVNEIVVEQLLDIVRNPCLNFAVMERGDVRYLGFADQDVTAEGRYRGNWLESGSSITEETLEAALVPVQRGAAMGYRGFAGIDVALTSDGRTYVLDLNFRANGCTTPLLLAAAVEERSGAAVMHFRKLLGSGSAEELARDLAPYVQGSRIVPLNLFDPVIAGHPNKPPSVQALILGSSREDALALEAELAAARIN